MSTTPHITIIKPIIPPEMGVLDLPDYQQVSQVPFRMAFTCASFKDINLTEMDTVALQERYDTKFGLSSSQLLSILPDLRADYRMLSVKGNKLQPYRTLYFDTEAFDLYNLHVNERANQYKVRIRQYLNTQEAFLEVKHKTPKGKTIKNRTPLDSDLPFLGKDEGLWLAEFLPLQYLSLEPKMINHFTRLVLVDTHHSERITLDFFIRFSCGWKSVSAHQIVIAEVKQGYKHQPSVFMDLMHRIHVREMGFSKYCVGLSLLDDQLKANTLKSRMLWMKKVYGDL